MRLRQRCGSTGTDKSQSNTSAPPGGPLETVVNEGTGFLCSPTAEAFGSSVVRLARDPSLGVAMGENGRRRVKEAFSMEVRTLLLLLLSSH